jgi:S1-C subfamily serine protease
MSNEILRSLSDGMADAVEQAGTATVLVNARKRLPVSGVLYANDLVLSVDHGIEKDEDIQVLSGSGEQAVGKVAGRDPGTDLAIIRLDHGIGSKAGLAEKPGRVGQPILALGRPEPEGIQASFGVITMLGGAIRTVRGSVLDQYLATDATPYPGFSGGPLIDLTGGILGINTSGLVGGISLAIPSSLAWKTAELLVAHGRVKRGFLGIRSQRVELQEQTRNALSRSQTSGLLIVGVEAGGPAAAAGVMIGDILTGLNNEAISDQDDLLVRLSGDVVGKAAPLEVIRGGQVTNLSITIGERS